MNAKRPFQNPACWPLLVMLSLLGGCDFARFVPVATVAGKRPLPPSIKTLRLDTRVGGIQVTAANGDELTIEAIVKANERKVEIEKASRAFESHVHVAENGGVLEIADAHRKAADRDSWQVELRVGVPRAVAVEANTGVGDVSLTAESVDSLQLEAGVGDITAEVKRVSGDARTKAGVGNLTLTLGAAAGSTEAEVGTGSVNVAFSAAPLKDVKVTAGVGEATLRLPAGSKGRFSGGTGVGSLNVRGLEGVRVQKTLTGGSLDGAIGDGPSYQVQTGTGDLTVEGR